jgi:hypothetical protein
MSTVVEIEAAIRQLPPIEARKLSDWLITYLDDAWDQQMQSDAENGKLDRLIARAESAIAAGQLVDMESMLGDTDFLQGLLDNPVTVEDFAPMTREQIYDR